MTIDQRLFTTIFLATMPILLAILTVLGVSIWNLVQIRSMRLALKHERLIMLPESLRPEHPVVVKP